MTWPAPTRFLVFAAWLPAACVSPCPEAMLEDYQGNCWLPECIPAATDTGDSGLPPDTGDTAQPADTGTDQVTGDGAMCTDTGMVRP